MADAKLEDPQILGRLRPLNMDQGREPFSEENENLKMRYSEST